MINNCHMNAPTTSQVLPMTGDNEFARYLASFLVQQEQEFVHVQDDSGLWLDEDRVYDLIKEFIETLP